MNTKNLNWILHAVTLMGLIFLWFQNQQLKSASNGNKSTGDLTKNEIAGNIAYFHTDSLLSKLNFFKQSEADFKKKQELIMKDLQGKEANLRSEFQRLQKNAENMTRNEMEGAQKKLAGMERDLMEQKEKMGEQFAAETAEFNEALHKKVVAFLKEFNADGKFDYIFSVARDGNIFYWDPKNDITQIMIDGLNEQYK